MVARKSEQLGIEQRLALSDFFNLLHRLTFRCSTIIIDCDSIHKESTSSVTSSKNYLQGTFTSFGYGRSTRQRQIFSKGYYSIRETL